MTFKLEADAPAAEKPRGYMAKAKRSDTNTPPLVVDLVLKVLDRIDIDPCSNPGSIVPARKEVWLQKYSDRYADLPQERKDRIVTGSGLRLAWNGTFFANPPFEHLTRWWRKCAGEHEVRGAEGILLCPARTDTRPFHAHARNAGALCFWKGRFVFLGEKHGCPFPPLFVYWGPRPARFREVFGAHGLVWRP